RQRNGAPGTQLSTAHAGLGRQQQCRQGRTGASVRRLSGRDGAGAAVTRGATFRLQSVIAMARSAKRSRAESFSVALLSWPQAARMSRPRGVRTGEAYPALNTISENFSIFSQSEHS